MQRIAIIRRNGLGDLICAYPTLLYLRAHHPDAHLTLFVDERNAPLLPYLPPADEAVVLPAKGNKYWNLLRASAKYQNPRFDLAISMKASPMKLMNFFLFTLRAKKKSAYVDSSFWSRFLINDPHLFDASKAKKMHQALKGLHLVDATFESVPESLYPKATVSEQIKNKYSIPFANPILLCSATTTRESSRLHPSRYAALINCLYKELPFSVILLGQEKDRARAKMIAAELTPPCALHFPRNFEEFMVLLDASDLFFVGDGGVAHIASALGKTSVVLFGQTDPQEWHPLSRKAISLYHPQHVDRLDEEEIFTALWKQGECLCKR